MLHYALKRTVEPSLSILLMLLRRGEVIFKWTSVALVITGLKYSTSLLYRAKVFALSSLVVHVACAPNPRYGRGFRHVT